MAAAPAAPDAGARRVASLLLSLDQTSAAALLRTIDPRVLPRVAAAMSRIEAEGENALAATSAWRDLVREINGGLPPPPRARDEEELGRFLEMGLGQERASAVLSEMRERRRIENPFVNVVDAPPARLVKALAGESTAVRALVLGHLPPKAAAGVLAALDPEESLRVVQRLSKAGAPQRETVDLVARNLQAEVERLANEPARPAPAERLRSIANILNNAGGEVGRNVLSALDQSDKSAADGIRELMFTWDDLAKLDRKAMQKVLSKVETNALALALKGSSPAVEENVLSNLSQRVREMLADEREMLGPRPRAEVEASRNEVLKNVRELVESGELSGAVSNEEMLT